MHITLIVSSTIGAFLYDRTQNLDATALKEATTYKALTAIQEIFLAYNMFFILDEKKKPDIIRDESRNITYQVLNVVKEK